MGPLPPRPEGQRELVGQVSSGGEDTGPGQSESAGHSGCKPERQGHGEGSWFMQLRVSLKRRPPPQLGVWSPTPRTSPSMLLLMTTKCMLPGRTSHLSPDLYVQLPSSNTTWRALLKLGLTKSTLDSLPNWLPRAKGVSIFCLSGGPGQSMPRPLPLPGSSLTSLPLPTVTTVLAHQPHLLSGPRHSLGSSSIFLPFSPLFTHQLMLILRHKL